MTERAKKVLYDILVDIFTNDYHRLFSFWVQLQKHLYLAVRHNDEEKVLRLLAAGADQFAEVEGTGLNPREEAMRQRHYPILRQMVALAKKEPRTEDDKIIALEDVYKLFEVSDRCTSLTVVFK